MKKTLLSLSLTLPILGQVYTPPAPTNNNNSTPSDTVTRSQPSQSTNNNANGGLLGNEVGVFDPTNDTISWNGSTWAASNNRLVAARFEKYLNEPENKSEAADEYRNTIDEILAILSPHREGGPVFGEAVALLPKAAEYPGDAKLCDSLSNAIYTAILSKKDKRRTDEMLVAMKQEKEKAILDADWKDRTERDPTAGNTTQGAGKGDSTETTQQAQQSGRGKQSLRYAEYVRRIAEIEAVKRSKELESKVKQELAKVQYQALMVQFFVQRRFRHVIMASRFYNQIWNEGDGTLYIDQDSDINKMFSESLGVSPTVSTLDSLANEAIRDVDKGVEVFSFLVEQEELESASKRLAEAFIVGEFMPSIDTLPREKKRKVLQFVRGSNVLLNAIDSKDYVKATAQIKDLQDKATDFDATKAQAAVATFTRASDMHIMMAKNHLAARDMEKAQESIRLAMEIWPQNPKLVEFDRLVSAGGSLIKLRNDFDRLFAEKNYREVFRRRFEFAPSIEGDADRKAKFMQVGDNITSIETAVQSAEELTNFGQEYAAWERLSEVHERFPDDPNLNQVMTRLAPKVADFTIALNNASMHENRGNVGSALSWFYKARHLHPGSEKAEEGIERLVQLALQ
ncbi:MAG: hypothetical protein ACJAVK_002463 [Akkermansiaceae bacterium]|jgi:hypothetical protein